MKILFIAPEIPWPLNKGTSQRTYALLKTLSMRHQITFSAPVEAGYEERISGIAELIESFIPVPIGAGLRKTLPKAGGRGRRFFDYMKSLLHGEPPFNFQMLSPEWRERLSSELSKHDMFFCRYMYLCEVFQGVSKEKLLIDADDLQYLVLWRKALSWNAGMESILVALESARTYFYERRRVNQCRQAFVCSDRDKAKLNSSNVTVIRNGVQLSGVVMPEVKLNSNTLLFIGAFTYTPNRAGLEWFCKNVWPLVREMDDKAILKVAGYGMDKVDMTFAHIEGVELIGEVDSPATAIRESLFMIVPLLFGTGTRVKIAEALGFGRPVVSTIIGAEGYDDFMEENGLFRADKPEEIAEIIVTLLADPKYCIEIGERARKIAVERLDWERATYPLLDFFQNDPEYDREV